MTRIAGRCSLEIFYFGSQRPGEGRRFSVRCGPEDESFCRVTRPGRHLSFANSASAAFCRGASFLVLVLAFETALAGLGVRDWAAGSNVRAAGRLAPARYRARRNCFANSSSRTTGEICSNGS